MRFPSQNEGSHPCVRGALDEGAMKLTLNGTDFVLNIERGVGPSQGADKMRGPRLAVTMVDRDNTLLAVTLDAAEAQTLATAMQAMAGRLRESEGKQ